jgi:hypothetical protein
MLRIYSNPDPHGERERERGVCVWRIYSNPDPHGAREKKRERESAYIF